MFRLLTLVMTLSLTLGCTNLRDAFSSAKAVHQPYQLLQKSMMSEDSVVLEISTIKIPSSQVKQIDRLFQTLDISRIELDQRKAWDRNGMRVGVIGTALPFEFDQILKSEMPQADSDEAIDETKLAPRRRIQARSGKPFRIATRAVQTELTWFKTLSDGYREGGVRAAAQPEIEVRSFAEGDGSVRLILHPEILYGEPKQVVTTSNASFRYEMKRDSIDFPDLRLESDLQLGESLVLAAARGSDKENSNDHSYGLGQTFFGGSNGETKLVIIRLAQSQKDDLFDSSTNSQPLESITEQ